MAILTEVLGMDYSRSLYYTSQFTIFKHPLILFGDELPCSY
jgi:hypothetical protein